MSEFGDWAATQLDRAGYTPAAGRDAQIVRTSVLRVCREFGEINFAAAGPVVEKQVLLLLTELLNRRALPAVNDTARWASARQFPPNVGSPVRVKLDAFDDERGTQLNGREAMVEGARRGQFIVAFADGRQPDSARLIAADLDVRIG